MEVISGEQHPVEVRVGAIGLNGDLGVPGGARGIVVFAHGSGSGRLSPRNQFVAQLLQQRKVGTLLMDLLTEQEEKKDAITGGRLRFDIPLLAGRLVGATDWLKQNP